MSTNTNKTQQTCDLIVDVIKLFHAKSLTFKMIKTWRGYKFVIFNYDINDIHIMYGLLAIRDSAGELRSITMGYLTRLIEMRVNS